MYDELKQAWAELTAPGQLFEVTEVEVGGQMLRGYALAPGSLRDLWLMSAQYDSADYLVYEDQRWSYREAHREVGSIANWLVANGVGAGDRVAIAMRNYPEWMLSYWAIVSIGASAVGINSWWVTGELQYALHDSAPRVLIGDEERLQRLQPVRDRFPDLKLVGVRLSGQPPEAVVDWAELLAMPSTLPEAAIEPDDDACIFYTSGTTGNPKGAQLTHRGCVNNVMSVAFANLVQAEAMAKLNGSQQPEQAPATIFTTPLFHVTANNCLAQVVTATGGKLVHMYKWDTEEALRLVEQEQITVLTGVPIMSREIINHPDFARRDTSSLKGLNSGGAPAQPDLVASIDQTSGGVIVPAQGYGLTETCGVISTISGVFYLDKPTSAGRVLPNFEIRCVDENGSELPAGEPGEICVKGSQVIKGYLNRPEETAESIVDGWLRTGDIGYLDEDGFLYLVDRSKDMVLRGGENVYSSEVEAAIYRHLEVAETAVFAVPDQRLGEEVGAAIYLRPGGVVSAAQLREFCKPYLAAYKIPRYIWFVPQPLPRNASGKFLKRELQQTLELSDAA